MNLFVSPQILGLAKSYITVLALERLLSRVGPLMLRQVGFVAEARFAERALERFLARVRALVAPQVGLLAESVAAEGALIGFLEFGVSPFVHPQIVRFAKGEIAVKTLERPRVQIRSLLPPRVTSEAGLGRVPLVCLLVNLQEDQLREARGAVLALERLVLSMRLLVLDQVHLLVKTSSAKRARK